MIPVCSDITNTSRLILMVCVMVWYKQELRYASLTSGSTNRHCHHEVRGYYIKCDDDDDFLKIFSGPEQRHGHPGCRQSDRDEERRGAGGLHRRDRHLGYVQPSLHCQAAWCLLLWAKAMGEISQTTSQKYANGSPPPSPTPPQSHRYFKLLDNNETPSKLRPLPAISHCKKNTGDSFHKC